MSINATMWGLTYWQTRRNSSRMCIVRLSTTPISAAARCQRQRGEGGPPVNKFEELPSLGHYMSLAGDRGPGSGATGIIVGWGPMHEGRHGTPLPPSWTDSLVDTHDWKYDLLPTSLAGSKMMIIPTGGQQHQSGLRITVWLSSFYRQNGLAPQALRSS